MSHILEKGQDCWTIRSASESGVLVDARDYYRNFYAAAGQAKRYILMSGWQFDSDTLLLEGRDARHVEGEKRFLPYLRSLCERNPALQIYILAWKYSGFLAHCREWFQEKKFIQQSDGRIHFRFDDRHSIGGCHHQKFVVIDGKIAFVGGMDVCARRWDVRSHSACGDPEYHPLHDVQGYAAGPIVRPLVRLFSQQWLRAGGGKLIFPVLDSMEDISIQSKFAVNKAPVAISRTQPRTLFPPQSPVREIRSMYAKAILSAEKFIYIENQYFSARVVFEALVRRMRNRNKGPLEIVLILPKRIKTWTERLAISFIQARMIRVLRRVSKNTGHRFGVYYPVAKTASGEIPVYIHSKLMIVDNRFMTVGSANVANRSMGLDTELNLAWDASLKKGEEDSIQNVFHGLLAEHLGMGIDETRLRFRSVTRLVLKLNRLARQSAFRLRIHPSMKEGLYRRAERTLGLDPETAFFEDLVFALVRSLFGRGRRRSLLRKWVWSLSR